MLFIYKINKNKNNETILSRVHNYSLEQILILISDLIVFKIFYRLVYLT